jgi:hypothetical protein
MFIKIALATALILGEASAVRASDAVSGSVTRVKPWVGKSANAGSAYGYVTAPIHKQRPAHEPNQRR